MKLPPYIETPVNPAHFLYNKIIDYERDGKKGLPAIQTSIDELCDSEESYSLKKINIYQKLRDSNEGKGLYSFDFNIKPALLDKILDCLGLSFKDVLYFQTSEDKEKSVNDYINERLSRIEDKQNFIISQLNSMKTGKNRLNVEKRLTIFIDAIFMLKLILNERKLFSYPLKESFFWAYANSIIYQGGYLNKLSDSFVRIFKVFNEVNIYYLNEKAFSFDNEINLYLQKNKTPSPIICASLSYFIFSEIINQYLDILINNYDKNLQKFGYTPENKDIFINFLKEIREQIITLKNNYNALIKFLIKSNISKVLSGDFYKECIEYFYEYIKLINNYFWEKRYFYYNFSCNNTKKKNLSFFIYPTINILDYLFILNIVNSSGNFMESLQSFTIKTENFINRIKNECV